MLQEPKGIMSVKNMNELFRLMEETERTAVMEAGLYKLISGLEHQDTCFHGPEGTWSVPCEDDLEVSTCEDARTISNCSDCCLMMMITKMLCFTDWRKISKRHWRFLRSI